MSEFINTADVIGDDEMCDQIIMRTVTEYKENRITKVGQSAFYNCKSLIKLIVPSAALAGGNNQCTGCTALEIADVLSIASGVWDSFLSCTSLKALAIRSSSVSPMSSPNLIGQTQIANGNGYIYVPRAVLDSYKAATNWSNVANQFRALEDYTVDGTITGELDETKI